VGVLADLADQRLAVFFRHPVPGLDPHFCVDLILENFFEFLYAHNRKFILERV
jgi:hypothetical protein